jgi:thiamine monophosphate synthase
VYATPTKLVADEVLGVARAADIIRCSTIPAVAIGGIDRGRLPEILAAGIRSYAVVRYVCQRAQPLDAIRELLEIEGETLASMLG